LRRSRDIVSGQSKVEDVDILGDPLGAEGLGNGHEPMIHVPTKHDLRRGLPVSRSKLKDSRVRERILHCARGGSVANAATEWRPRFGNDAEARVGLAHLALNEIRVQLNLVHRWAHFRPFHEGLQVHRAKI
jgi:hypothetical protein